MTRKRNNPSKIELLGKIPDPSIAKIFRTSTYQIKKERETRGIPTSSVRSKKKIKEVLQSLNASGPCLFYNLPYGISRFPKGRLSKLSSGLRRACDIVSPSNGTEVSFCSIASAAPPRA